MKIVPGGVLRNGNIPHGKLPDSSPIAPIIDYKLTASSFKLYCGQLNKRVHEEENYLFILDNEKSSVCYTGITTPLSRRSVSMTTMVDRCSHTMRQKSFTVLVIGP